MQKRGTWVSLPDVREIIVHGDGDQPLASTAEQPLPLTDQHEPIEEMKAAVRRPDGTINWEAFDKHAKATAGQEGEEVSSNYEDEEFYEGYAYDDNFYDDDLSDGEEDLLQEFYQGYHGGDGLHHGLN